MPTPMPPPLIELEASAVLVLRDTSTARQGLARRTAHSTSRNRDLLWLVCIVQQIDCHAGQFVLLGLRSPRAADIHRSLSPPAAMLLDWEPFGISARSELGVMNLLSRA